MLLQPDRAFKLSECACPRCRCKGNFARHGSYVRRVVYLDGERDVEVTRVRCMSCLATHAIIPPDVVPYRAYSESLVLAILGEWY